ncbi:MAG: CotH kinase family protein, partial [Bacteroidales bacterium]
MKALLITYVLILLQIQILGQNMKTFYIDCDQEEFNEMYENYDQNIVIDAQLTYDSNSWTNISLRIRGDGSKEYPKKSLEIKFDSIPFTTGEQVLNFNAEYRDISYMRSFLSSFCFRSAGIACPAMEHVVLYLNGSFFGIYLMTEEVDDLFLKNNGFPDDGNLYKAQLDGACLSIYDNIYYHWKKVVDAIPGRDDLAHLIQMLNHSENENYPEFLDNTFDYERLTTLIALNMLIANGSTYYHNYYLFNNTGNQGKWEIIPWDLDLTLAAYSKWYPFHRSSGFWTPDNPLLERSLINDLVFGNIQVKVSQLSSDLFNAGSLFPVIDSLYDVLLPYIPLDTTDQIEDIETWDQYIESNRDFITTRINHLNYQFQKYPRNFKLHRKIGYFKSGEPVLLTWDTSSDPNNLNLYYHLYYGKDRDLTDSTAHIVTGLTTNFYQIDGLEEEGKYYWKVEVTNNIHGTLPGFDTYNTFFVSSGIPFIVINEINYKSSPDFNTGDWIEFYNPNDTSVSLFNWYFMDDNNAHRFTFSEEDIIDPHGYLVLCRDTSAFREFFPLASPITGNMDFGLSSAGELVRLYNPIGYLVDNLVYKS